MDHTHIRFFTFGTAKELVAHAGCGIVAVDYMPMLVRAFLPLIKIFFKSNPVNGNPRQIIDSPFYKLYEKYIYPIEYWCGYLWKAMFAFRIIIIGKKI